MATKTFRLIRDTMGSEYTDFFVRFVRLLQNALYDVYFAPQASKRVETAWEGSPERLERSGPQKNLFRSNISREMGTQISVRFIRRRLWRRRILPTLRFGPSSIMCQAGQHSLPGGQDCLGPGVFRICNVNGSRFESDVTLQVSECILEYESDGGKRVANLPRGR